MVKKLFPCLALILTLSLSAVTFAQDAKQENEKPKAAKQDKKAKAKQKKIDQVSKRFTRELKGIELTEDQRKKLSGLIEEQLDTLKDLTKQANGIITRENRKTVNETVKAARAEGKSWPEATKAAWDKAGISEEDQATLKEVNSKRNELLASIKKELVATFSEEQKKAMAASRKGKKGKGKGKGKKKNEADSETTSVSISLPGMT